MSENIASRIPHRRYEVLDSWRGICACLVVVFHFDAYSHAYDWLLIRNGIMFVDFFFVLSGFVIAFGYADRLRQGFGVLQFMWLRTGRIYPLHFFMLMVFVLFEFSFGGLVSQYSPTGREAFTGANSIEKLIANIFLLQSINLFDDGSWNVPSWSISVEFYNYIIFAVIAASLSLRAYRLALVAVVLLLCVMFITIDGLAMGAAYQWGILRCLYGFAAGALAHQIVVQRMWVIRWLESLSFSVASLVEILAAAAAGFFIAYGKFTFWWNFTPFVFAMVLIVFSEEKGIVSRLLRTPPFLFLGALSYSIYLVHYFIQLRLMNVAALAQKLFDVQLFTIVTEDGASHKLLGQTLWQGDVLYIVMLAIVVGASYLTYRFIEMPCMRLSRDLARRIWKRPAPARAAASAAS